MGESKIKYYSMGFDSNNNTLRPIYDKLDSLIDKGYGLSNVFKDIIFRGCNQFDRDYRGVPCWVRDAGNTAECGWTKEEFETYVRNHEDYEIVHRWLYYYDCKMLVCALCDRFKMIASMLRVFYNHFPSESPCKMEDFKQATVTVSPQDTICFACVNSIFLYLASSFDILSKIYVELRDYEKLDFSKYPKMVSRKVLLGSIVKTNSDITGTIFEKPSCVNTIVNIRNRLVHDGSFDFMQMVYDCYDGPNGHSEGTILFPDMVENGLFVTSKNRKNFYSQSNRLNLLLPGLLTDVFDVMETTINKLSIIGKKENEG